MLGFHALAVTQAGAYISALDYRLDEYFEQCLKTNSPLEKCALKNIPIDHDYPLGLYATWMLSYEKLSSETLQLLHYFAFMHHSGITEDIFRVAYNRIYHQGQISESSLPSFLCQFEDPNAAGAWSSLAFRDATMEARNYCLIEYNRQAGVYSIHPLVHQWIQKLAPANVVKSVAGLLALCVCEQTKLDDFDFGRTLLPHIDALPEAQKVDQSSASQFSLVYREAGRWTDAQNLEETVLNHRRERLGEVHPETLNSMHNLGAIYRERGRWEQAEQMLKKAMELRKKLNENSAKAIDSANQLAWVYLEQRKWEPARILEEEVLQTKRYVKGENDTQTLESMGQLAWAYWGLNRFSDAQRLEEEVVEANKRSLTIGVIGLTDSVETSALKLWSKLGPLFVLKFRGQNFMAG
ncbi:hypothetical protein FRC12_001316 [Ceratobasidium sp. 428]|nr:hypothetical protein FRC12_001316 [Ceratobasidium sp. 428]